LILGHNLEKAFKKALHRAFDIGYKHKMLPILKNQLLSNKDVADAMKAKGNKKRAQILIKKVAKQVRSAAQKKIIQNPKLIKYFIKIGEAINEGIILFTKTDKDGVERDYFGFPNSMGIGKRRQYLMGSSKMNNFARLFGIELPVSQSQWIWSSSVRRKDKFAIEKIIEFKNSGLDTSVAVKKVLNELKTKKFGIWMSKKKKGGERNAFGTLRRTYYNRKKYVK